MFECTSQHGLVQFPEDFGCHEQLEELPAALHDQLPAIGGAAVFFQELGLSLRSLRIHRHSDGSFIVAESRSSPVELEALDDLPRPQEIIQGQNAGRCHSG